MKSESKAAAWQRKYVASPAGRAKIQAYEVERRRKAKAQGLPRRDGRKTLGPRVIAARRKLRRSARGTHGSTWAQGRCQSCGSQFAGSVTRDLPRFCSPACKNREKASRRRAVEVAAFVEKVYRRKVFDRDGWKCQLCRTPVKRDAVVPHPLAPVLDHVVPLALGGEHSMRNVQCAHFLCNSTKSHGVHGAGEQLRMIG